MAQFWGQFWGYLVFDGEACRHQAAATAAQEEEEEAAEEEA